MREKMEIKRDRKKTALIVLVMLIVYSVFAVIMPAVAEEHSVFSEDIR
jgi:hypothetical protein